MRSLPRRSRSDVFRRMAPPPRASGLVAAVLVLAGCASAGKPGVAVSSLQSDVSFGTVASSAATPTVPVAKQAPQLPGVMAAAGNPAFQFDAGSKGSLTPITGGTSAGQQACPDPIIGTSVAKAASEVAQGTPAPGYYLYKVQTGKIVASLPVAFHTSLINVKVLPASKITTTPNPGAAYPQTKFTYQEVQPEPGGGQLTFTFDVVNYPITQQDEPPPAAGTVGGTQNFTVGGDDGVSIVSEVRTDAKGATVWSFNPTTPVTLIPLPVVSGTTFTSTGTDPSTGQSLSLKATVAKTDRLVGCGVFIQGWQVQATQVGRAPAPDGSVSTVNGDAVYDVATQYGGLVIATRFTPGGSTSFTGGQIGTVTPTKRPSRTN